MGDLYHFEIIPTYEIGTSDCQKGDPKMGHDCDHYQSHEHLENVLEETFRHIFQVFLWLVMARSQNCGISVFEMLGRFGLGGQVWPYMHNSNQKSSNCNKEVAPKTCHFKQTICRLQKNLIFTQFFPFSSLNLWFTHVLSRKCRKWHLRALVGSFSLKSRMVGRLDNSGAGIRHDLGFFDR